MTTFFMSTWWGDSKNMEEIEFSRWFFEGRPRQGKKLLPDWLDWLSYLAGSSKSHRAISISYIFLQSPHQVDMKNVVKWWKDFLLYFTTLETYRVHVTCWWSFFHLVIFLEHTYKRLKIQPWINEECRIEVIW